VQWDLTIAPPKQRECVAGTLRELLEKKLTLCIDARIVACRVEHWSLSF
jgi:hypothetical protein